MTFKWVARHFGVPTNVAKQLLFSFQEAHSGKVKATYLLAGWTKQQPRQHVVQLTPAEQLSTASINLDPVTSMHVYSVQPSQPQVGLANHEKLSAAENCMAKCSMGA